MAAHRSVALVFYKCVSNNRIWFWSSSGTYFSNREVLAHTPFRSQSIDRVDGGSCGLPHDVGRIVSVDSNSLHGNEDIPCIDVLKVSSGLLDADQDFGASPNVLANKTQN